MKSLFLYNSLLADVFEARIDFKTARFKAMLVTGDYRPDQRNDSRRSDITGEAAGPGYPAGGVPVTITAIVNPEDVLEITCGRAQLDKASLTARGIVYYVDRGGDAAADELVAFDDFGQDVTGTNAPYTVEPRTFTFEN